jgi:hypothetical protein
VKPPEPVPAPGALPFTDSKPVGAADFYFAINATFRFIEQRFGPEGLRRYWRELGSGYYAPVSAAWKRGGLPAIAQYWRAFFQAEPAAEVQVQATAETVIVEVRTCPVLRHLRGQGRSIVPCFCQHCYYVSEAMAAAAGFCVRVQGGNGACRQTFRACAPSLPPQNLASIKEVQ